MLAVRVPEGLGEEEVDAGCSVRVSVLAGRVHKGLGEEDVDAGCSVQASVLAVRVPEGLGGEEGGEEGEGGLPPDPGPFFAMCTPEGAVLIA